MEEIEGEISSEYVLRSPCCKTALYHKECIQVGISSLYGYFNTVHSQLLLQKNMNEQLLVFNKKKVTV